MRMNKVYYNELYDIYGSLLTKRQQEILQLYFQEDFSYAEISEELSISRAAVLDAVHRNQVFELIKDDSILLEKIQEIL